MNSESRLSPIKSHETLINHNNHLCFCLSMSISSLNIPFTPWRSLFENRSGLRQHHLCGVPLASIAKFQPCLIQKLNELLQRVHRTSEEHRHSACQIQGSPTSLKFYDSTSVKTQTQKKTLLRAKLRHIMTLASTRALSTVYLTSLFASACSCLCLQGNAFALKRKTKQIKSINMS